MEPPRSEALTRALAPIVDELLTPALVLDLDAVAHNIAASVERFGGADRWRPHLKTVKQAVVIELLLRAGVRHFKVATCDELALLLRCVGELEGVDVLFAYPASGPTLAAVRTLASGRATRVSVLADSPAHLEQLASAAPGLPVMLDVDLGMRRTGTIPEAWLDPELAPKLDSSLARVELVGLHGYDGHLRWDQRERAHLGYDRLCVLAEQLGPRLAAPAELVTSGTHSYAHALAHPRLAAGPWRHRVSPGTILLSDLRSHEAAADIGLRQAAFVASRVISVGPGRITCDAGSKAITPDGSPPACAVLDHPELAPQRASEEHLPCEHDPGAAAPALGELVWLIPDHVCTTVNLHREAVWLRDGAFAGFGPIAASGHRPRAPAST